MWHHTQSSLQSLCLAAFAAAVLVACEPNNAPQSDKDLIIGKYDWLVNGSSHRGTTHIAYEGYIIDVYESTNPRSAGARVAGFWKVLDKEKRQYLLHWKDPWNEFKDTLVLSEDGNYLKGTNNYGDVIEGKRVHSVKTSSVKPESETDSERRMHLRSELSSDAANASSEGFRVLGSTSNEVFSFKGNGYLDSQLEKGLKALRAMSESDLKWRGIDTSPRPKDWLYKLWPDK
jgi:hypothetical protein